AGDAAGPDRGPGSARLDVGLGRRGRPPRIRRDLRFEEGLQLRVAAVPEQVHVDLACLVSLAGRLVQPRGTEEGVGAKGSGDGTGLRERVERLLRVTRCFLGMGEAGEGLLAEVVGGRRAREIGGVGGRAARAPPRGGAWARHRPPTRPNGVLVFGAPAVGTARAAPATAPAAKRACAARKSMLADSFRLARHRVTPSTMAATTRTPATI